MQPARIAELLAPFLDEANDQRLTTRDLEDISMYIDILRRWNAHINLTAIRDPEAIVTRHFGESLFAARLLFPKREHVGTAVPGAPAKQSSAECDKGRNDKQDLAQERGRADHRGRVEGQRGGEALAPEIPNLSLPLAEQTTLSDIGSGAGFPGIPIKLWQPTLGLTLIESNHKKATFLREISRALTLTDINILTARAESIAASTFDIVTLRAVERFESIFPVAARLVAPSGRLALLIGSAQLPAVHSTLEQINGFSADRRVSYPIPLSSSRTLLVAERST
jgi:16S rRNA (guanine(527)-N(7))-methyltransferase RsmG